MYPGLRIILKKLSGPIYTLRKHNPNNNLNWQIICYVSDRRMKLKKAYLVMIE